MDESKLMKAFYHRKLAKEQSKNGLKAMVYILI